MSQLDRSSAFRRSARRQTGSAGPSSVALQPIVDLATGATWAQEALCRVPDSPFSALVAGGGSPPSDVALVLEARMLQRALDARARVPADQALSVNVTPSALLTADVERVLRDAGSLEGVIVELTEHHTPEAVDDLVPAVERLRVAGAGIALDHVGGGRGALRYARRLAPDFIKLDGDIVRRLDTEPLQRIMVESALAVARALDIPVTAGGIETSYELDLLLRMGITLGQGNLLAHPAPEPGVVSPHVRRWLRARAGRLAARTAVARGPQVATAS